MKKTFVSVATIIVSLVILSSCSINSNLTQPQASGILIGQLSPNSSPINLLINGSAISNTDIPYGAVSGYATLNPGTYKFTADSTSLSTSVALEANKYYSFFLIDSVQKLKSVLVNDLFQRPSGDSVYVRFFNFALNLPAAVNLVDSVSNSQWSQSRTFNDLANPQYVSFAEHTAGNYTLHLTNSVDNSMLATKKLTLIGGHVYTIVAKGIYNYSGTDTSRALSVQAYANY